MRFIPERRRKYKDTETSHAQECAVRYVSVRGSGKDNTKGNVLFGIILVGDGKPGRI